SACDFHRARSWMAHWAGRPRNRRVPGGGGVSNHLADAQRTRHAVLVKAISPIGAAEVGAIDTIYLCVSFLRGYRLSRVDWMLVGDALQDFRFVDGVRVVER